MNHDEIRVIVDDTQAVLESSASLQARSSFEEAIRRTMGASVSLQVSGITDQLADTYEKVTSAIGSLPKAKNGCTLETVSFTLTISSTGEVSLLSAIQGKLEGHTGLTFTVQKAS